jgi:aryl-alcohol dehydrogenase-like predicted oxidoreductase
LRDAFDLGIRHFDTASIYGQGDSERYIGEAFKSVRNEVCISTKAGQRLSSIQAVVATFKTPIRWILKFRGSMRQVVQRRRAAGVNYCFDPAFIESSLYGSLRRLQTDRVDIFYLHSPPVKALSDERLMGLMQQLRREKRIGAIGVSCDDLEIALAASEHPLVEVVQYDLSDDPHCTTVRETAARNGKVSLVRGIARHAVHQEGSYEDNLVSGFYSALGLASVGGVIIGTTNTQHLRTNTAGFKRAFSRFQERAG